MTGPNASPLHMRDNPDASGLQPSQQSFHQSGLLPENASMTNRPRFDQISDATRYVFNQPAAGAANGAAGGQGAYLSNQAQARNSVATNNVIEEEDYQ